jgi:hypothetical protein
VPLFGGSAHTPAYDAAVTAVDSGNRAAALGNRAAALKALVFAQSQLPQMTLAERSEMSGKISVAMSSAGRVRTPAEIAAAKQNLAARTAQEEALAREEMARTGGRDPGGQWWNPASWAYDASTGTQTGGFFAAVARGVSSVVPGTGIDERPGQVTGFQKLVGVLVVGVGLYATFKILGFISEGRRYRVDRDRLGVERERVRALSSNPRRRRRRR